ncbi:MAG: TIGR02206 family membrane protein [Oscillospiraceae bacterium]|nr:TIGR02206 family membrane protein [Oscillospiraceae bacterium]
MQQIRDFLKYFIGQGDRQEFAIFTLAHLMPILVAAGIIWLIYRFREPLRNWKGESGIRHAIALIMIISEMAYYWRLVAIPSLGPNPVENLPIAVCGWVVILGSLMMVGKSQKLFDIIYFWIFSGTVFALLTPTVLTYTGPTRFRYYQFWTEHVIGYIGVFYMIFVHGMRPVFKSLIRSYIALLVMVAVAYFTNMLIPGANYLYVARPESAPSVLDILPPNFLLRFLVMASVITAMYFLAYLPWYLKDKKKKKQEVPEETTV